MRPRPVRRQCREQRSDKFGGALEGGNGDAEERLTAEERAHDYDTGNGREYDGTKNTGAPASDDFFDDEETAEMER